MHSAPAMQVEPVQQQRLTADATADVAGERQELWARARELYASFAVLLSQCLVDAPHLMRHLRLFSSAASLVQAQVCRRCRPRCPPSCPPPRLHAADTKNANMLLSFANIILSFAANGHDMIMMYA